MNFKHLTLMLFLAFALNVGAQDYKSQVVESKFSKTTLVDNTMNWLLGYARTSKIDKLKAESSSGESISGDEDYITWEVDGESNLLISNTVKYSKDVLIKYNVQIKIKDNKCLIVVKNVFWKNPRYPEKYPYIPITQRGYPDQNREYTEKAHNKILSFFDDYIQKEIFNSLGEYLEIEPVKYDNW